MLSRFVAPAAVALAIAASGCVPHPGDPAALADGATRGVYDVDYDKTTQNFDGALKMQVSRASIGQLSDKLHALGTYQGLKAVSADADKGRYDYQASFAHGTALVQIRVDPNGKIGAYRISQLAPAPTTR